MSASPRGNEQDAWGWKVAAYLFASGMGAGAYAVGAVARHLGPDWRVAATAGLLLGPLLVGPATLFLVWDLGRPAGFMRAARRPRSSWISRGVVILTGFVLVSAAHVVLGAWLGREPVLLSIAGELLALLTMVYTGLLLGAVRPIPAWSTPILPLLFVVSSLSTGLMAVDGAVTLATALTGNGPPVVLRALRTIDLALLGLEAVVIALYLALGHATAAARASTSLLLRGWLAPRFWGGVALAGLGLPCVIQVVELAQPGTGPAWLAIASSGLGLAGGLILRHVVIAAGVRTPLAAAGMVFPARVGAGWLPRRETS